MHSEKHLNIISFDVPYPPDYGGVIDVFYKIKALSELGIKIHLHVFKYGRPERSELLYYCEEVYYYKRKIFSFPSFAGKPYIVKTRRSVNLLENLIKNDYPILIEGLHCSYYLNHHLLKDRLKIVRMHNNEYIYYKHLAKVERSFYKKIYFNIESGRLRAYQNKLANADFVASISPSEHALMHLKHSNSFYLPVFHPNDQLTCKPGKGDYILYHGNLAVGENNEAAIFLVKEVFSKISLPAIIAGSNPSKQLKEAIQDQPNVKLISNIPLSEIYDLIENAHINILPTFQETGIKLKLLNALYRGRFCVVNKKMVRNTGLEELCVVVNGESNWQESVLYCFTKEFTESDIAFRKKFLENEFKNLKNAEKLIQKLF